MFSGGVRTGESIPLFGVAPIGPILRSARCMPFNFRKLLSFLKIKELGSSEEILLISCIIKP